MKYRVVPAIVPLKVAGTNHKWQRVQVGWTVQNNKTGKVSKYKPWMTREGAEVFAAF